MIVGLIVMYAIILYRYAYGNISDALFLASIIMVSTIFVLIEVHESVKQSKRLKEVLVGSLSCFILDEDGNIKDNYKQK